MSHRSRVDTITMPGQRAVQRQSLPDVIANDIRERILSGELEEGMPIRQDALAVEYDVSRMPIREALKRLDAEGLVVFTTNRGATVVKHSPAEVEEIFDLRTMLETDLFRRSIPRMTEADLIHCETLLEAMEVSYDTNDVGQWGALNSEYHLALYAAADRTLSAELLHRLNLQCDRYVRMHLSVMHMREPARADHRKLLEMARKRLIEEGCAILENHIQRTKQQLLELIAEKKPD